MNMNVMKRMAVMLLAVLQVMYALAGNYTYTVKRYYAPPSSGTTDGPTIDYYNEILAGGTTAYTNGQLKVSFRGDDGNGNFTFRFSKQSGYFVNGNKGKVFVYDFGNSKVTGYPFRITNSTTSYIDATFYVGNFTVTRHLVFYLITSDQKYFQYGGDMLLDGEVQIEVPAVETLSPKDVQDKSATLRGRVDTKGSETDWYFMYGLNGKLDKKTSPKRSHDHVGSHIVSTEVTGLTPNSNYSVKLVAENEAGKNTGNKVSFTTTESRNNPPEKATSPSPTNGARDVAVSGNLSWSCSDPDGDALSYTVYIGKDKGEMKRQPSTTNRYIPYQLDPETKYNWYVVSFDNKERTASDTWTFTTDRGSGLNKPTNPSPANGATGVPISGTLSWECNNPGANVKYKVSIGTSASNMKSKPLTEETHIQYSGLEKNRDYWWQVEVSDGTQVVKNSQPWKFRTGSGSADITYDCTFPDEDLKPGKSAFYEPTCFLYKRGVLSGSDVNGRMDAEKDLQRNHLAKIAFRGVYSINGRSVPNSVPSDNYPTIYDDLKEDSYYYQAARAMFYLEYGDGVSPFDRNRTKFEPTKSITRLHTLKVLLEAFNIEPDLEHSNNPFPGDNDVVDLARNNPRMMGYIRKAASLGIVLSGNDRKYFYPYANCLRGEAFTMLARIMQKIEDGTIVDPHPNEEDYFEPLNITLQTISAGAGLSMGSFNHYAKTSFALDGVVPLVLTHSYNSYSTTLPEVFFAANDYGDTYQPLGDGWSHNYHTYITVLDPLSSSNAIPLVHWGGGRIDVYRKEGSKFVPTSYGVYDDFSVVGNEIVITNKSQIKYHFASLGHPDGVIIYYLVSITDLNDNKLELEYESGENGYKRISSVSDGYRSLTFYYKRGTNLLEKVTDPSGRSVKYSYELNKRTQRYQLVSFTDAKEQTTRYQYGDDDDQEITSKLLTKIQLPKGNYIRNEYDANRRLSHTESGVYNVPTSQTDVDVKTSYGSTISTRSKINVMRDGTTSTYTYRFNANNRITDLLGEEDLKVKVKYEDPNNPLLPTSMKSNSANVSNIEYDKKGNVKKIKQSGDGELITQMTYDDKNNLTSVTDPNGSTTYYTYDSKCNLTKIEAPEGVTINITDHNSKGLPTRIIDPMNVETILEYNQYGNLKSSTLKALNLTLTTSAEYDRLSRLKKVKDALLRTYQFEYDKNDNLTLVKDPMSHETSYDYDENDNLTTITNAANRVTTLEYDDATDWLTSVEFEGAKKQFEYNEDGTLKSYTKPDKTTLDYNYDDLGRIASDGVYSYSYGDNLLLRQISGGGSSLTFDYDGFNRISRTRYGGNSNVYEYDNNGNCTRVNNTRYEYDKLNRLHKVEFNGDKIVYFYRKDSQLERVVYPNGMFTTFGYDEVGRLVKKITMFNSGKVIASYNLELNKVGNITKQTAQEPYEEVVLTEENVSYNFTYGNRITKAGDISFAFDDNGNTKKRGSESYSWDKLDRLVSVGSTKISYNPLGQISSYGDITFTTDPLGIGNVLSDSRSGAEYIYGNGLEARVKDGKASYYVTDLRGSVVAIVDEAGNITHKYQYDEFGKVLQKEEVDYNPFQYVGKYGVMCLNDHLYYMRARYYDPTIGRFLSEDPIWSTNLYPYADNNPIMGIDPEGLIVIQESSFVCQDKYGTEAPYKYTYEDGEVYCGNSSGLRKTYPVSNTSNTKSNSNQNASLNTNSYKLDPIKDCYVRYYLFIKPKQKYRVLDANGNQVPIESLDKNTVKTLVNQNDLFTTKQLVNSCPTSVGVVSSHRSESTVSCTIKGGTWDFVYQRCVY